MLSDILLSNEILMFQIEGNIWNVFNARISCEASLEKGWYGLIFNIQNEILTRNEEKYFSTSYIDGIST